MIIFFFKLTSSGNVLNIHCFIRNVKLLRCGSKHIINLHPPHSLSLFIIIKWYALLVDFFFLVNSISHVHLTYCFITNVFSLSGCTASWGSPASVLTTTRSPYPHYCTAPPVRWGYKQSVPFLLNSTTCKVRWGYTSPYPPAFTVPAVRWGCYQLVPFLLHSTSEGALHQLQGEVVTSWGSAALHQL